MVMFITTTLLAIQIPLVKNLPWILGVGFFLFFGFLDGMFNFADDATVSVLKFVMDYGIP